MRITMRTQVKSESCSNQGLLYRYRYGFGSNQGLLYRYRYGFGFFIWGLVSGYGYGSN